MEMGGGAGDAAEVGDGDEGGQLLEIHRPTPDAMSLVDRSIPDWHFTAVPIIDDDA
jgi:hypothetical protein